MPPFIIIVDNKPFLPDTLEMIISNYFPNQFTILAFNNTTSAFNIIEELSIKKETIAMIMCDSQMPNLAGYEFLNLVNTLSPNSTKIISTTYIRLKEYQELLSSDLIDFILEKPFNTNALINIIQSSLKQHQAYITNQKNSDTIQSLKASISTLRNKYQSREQTIFNFSNSLNAFYFRLNLKNSLLDIYAVKATIFGYETKSFTDFDSFISIVEADDQTKFIESIRKIKVMLTKEDSLYLNFIDKDKNTIQAKCLLIGEKIDNITGTKAIIGFVQNITAVYAEYQKIIKPIK